MANYRKEKLTEILQHLAAEFIARESNRKSLITITGAQISQSQRKVVLLFTVMPESQEEAAKDFLSRQKYDFVKYVDEHARVGRMPEIDFVLDIGEKNRQRIDFLSDKN